MKIFNVCLFIICLMSLYSCTRFKIPVKLDSKNTQKKELDRINKKSIVLSRRLRLAEKQVRLAKSDYEAYVSKYPNSVLVNYDSVIKKLELEYNNLDNELKNLRKRYQELMDEFKKGFVVNTEGLNAQIYKINFSLDEYIQQVKLNYVDKSPVVEVIFPTDIIFPLASFEVSRYDKQHRIKKYVDKVRSLINTKFKNYKPEDLLLSIKVTGFTDGHPIAHLMIKVKLCQACGLPLNASQKNLNRCLSRLRAQAVCDLLAKEFGGYQISKNIIGKGDVLANGNTQHNPKIRRVDVSILISTKPSKD